MEDYSDMVTATQLVDKLDDETPAEPPGAHVGAGVTQKITFATIQRARLDKLLVDMLRAYDKEATAVPLGGIITETGLGSEIECKSSRYSPSSSGRVLNVPAYQTTPGA